MERQDDEYLVVDEDISTLARAGDLEIFRRTGGNIDILQYLIEKHNIAKVFFNEPGLREYLRQIRGKKWEDMPEAKTLQEAKAQYQKESDFLKEGHAKGIDPKMLAAMRAMLDENKAILQGCEKTAEAKKAMFDTYKQFTEETLDDHVDSLRKAQKNADARRQTKFEIPVMIYEGMNGQAKETTVYVPCIEESLLSKQIAREITQWPHETTYERGMLKMHFKTPVAQKIAELFHENTRLLKTFGIEPRTVMMTEEK